MPLDCFVPIPSVVTLNKFLSQSFPLCRLKWPVEYGWLNLVHYSF